MSPGKAFFGGPRVKGQGSSDKTQYWRCWVFPPVMHRRTSNVSDTLRRFPASALPLGFSPASSC